MDNSRDTCRCDSKATRDVAVQCGQCEQCWQDEDQDDHSECASDEVVQVDNRLLELCNRNPERFADEVTRKFMLLARGHHEIGIDCNYTEEEAAFVDSLRPLVNQVSGKAEELVRTLSVHGAIRFVAKFVCNEGRKSLIWYWLGLGLTVAILGIVGFLKKPVKLAIGLFFQAVNRKSGNWMTIAAAAAGVCSFNCYLEALRPPIGCLSSDSHNSDTIARSTMATIANSVAWFARTAQLVRPRTDNDS